MAAWMMALTFAACGNSPALTPFPSTSGTIASAMPSGSVQTTATPGTLPTGDAVDTSPAASEETTAGPGQATDSTDPQKPQTEPSEPGPAASSEPTGERTDYSAYLPNELGRVPVVMFHKFVETFEPDTDKYYANTFTQLEALLQTLYERNFRMVSMDDFLSGRIDIPAGCKPVVFTFDDGTPSQFSLVRQNGALAVNPRTAVGIMMAFAQQHPDFGMAGSFYLNMDVNVFAGEGTEEDRLRTLLDMGLDIGTHTWGHVNFTSNGTPQDIQQALGRNQQALSEILPERVFRTLALPYGSRPKDKAARPFLGQGTWEGIAYRHDGAFAVGAGPTVPGYHVKFDPLYIARVRATGKVAEEADFDWWLANASEASWYTSDGNPETIVFPQALAENLVAEKAEPLRVISYP